MNLDSSFVVMMYLASRVHCHALDANISVERDHGEW